MTAGSPHPSPATIYHYTSSSGLLGILNTRSIWLSHTDFLNDLSEVRYAAQHIFDITKNFNEELANHIKESYLDPDLQLSLEHHPYVASFCKADNLLSMWRSYGTDGFSIGFDRSCLNTLLSKPNQVWNSLTKDENASLQENNFGIGGTIVDITYGFDRATISKIPSPSDNDSLQSISRALTAIKNPQFREEQEVRIIAFSNSCMTRPLLRERRGRLILYRPLAFPFKAVRSITVGPGAHQSSNFKALKQYFETFPSPRGEWSHLEIRSSDIPFRQD